MRSSLLVGVVGAAFVVLTASLVADAQPAPSAPPTTNAPSPSPEPPSPEPPPPASAQPSTRGPSEPSGSAGGDSTPSAPPATAAPGQSAELLPALPAVSDPMLELPARPSKQLKDWRQAVQLVSSQSPDLQIARAQIAEATAQARQALSGALPQLTANGSLTRHVLLGEGINFSTGDFDPATAVGTIPDPATRWQGSLNFRQPVLALARWDEIGTAKRTAKLSALTAQDNERQILASVANLIVAVITAERLSEVSRINLQSALSTLDLTRRRARLGAAAALDVLRSQREVASSRGQVIQADEAVKRASEALGMGLGFSEPWGVSPGVDINGLVKDARQVCTPTERAEQRADVQAAQLGVEIALRRRDNTDLLFAPTVDLVSDATYSNSPQTINGEAVQWTVGALLSVPLYDGSLRYGLRDQAEAGIDVARAQLDQAQRAAQLEIVRSRRNVGVAQERLSVSAESRRIARETARLASVSFLHGTGTSFDVVEEARRQREAEIDYVLKEFELIQAQILALLAAANCDL